MECASFYNRFSLFYPVVDVFLKPQKRLLVREVNEQAPGDLLEMGIGTGSHLPLYERHRITGIDTSVGMLKKVPGAARVKLLEMDATNMDFPDNCFDYIVISHVLAVVEDPQLLVREANRVLKRGGKIFVLNHFSPDNLLGRMDLAMGRFSGLIHLRSDFKLQDLQVSREWCLIKNINLGFLDYYKLLIFEKR